MVIHLKQNYISHLPPGLCDGWQGLQPKQLGLIAPLSSVTNVSRKTDGTLWFHTVLNENMFVKENLRLKYKGLFFTHRTILEIFLFTLTFVFLSVSGVEDYLILIYLDKKMTVMLGICVCVLVCLFACGRGTNFVNQGRTSNFPSSANSAVGVALLFHLLQTMCISVQAVISIMILKMIIGR